MALIPNAIDIPGLTDAINNYNLNKKPSMNTEYAKLVTFVVDEIVPDLTEANNFIAVKVFKNLDLSFVIHNDRILKTVQILCDKLKDELKSKGYYADINPYMHPLPEVIPDNFRLEYDIACVICACNNTLFY